MAETIERGALFFFYRNVIDVERAESLDDVQRMYMALVPDGGGAARLALIGHKRLPDIVRGESEPEERIWMMIVDTGEPQQLADALRPLEYETKTRGTRRQPEAIPAGEGRYELRLEDSSTVLAYRLTRPESPGPAQEALRIRPRAGYVISVRNPALDVPGFPDADPGFPEPLREAFANMRWLGLRDPSYLDYSDAQLVLIGAYEDPEERGADLSGEVSVFETFGLDPDAWPDQTLREGTFSEARYPQPLLSPDGDRSKGGRRGGRAAARTASASGIAHALGGIELPQGRRGLVEHARDNGAADEVIDVLERFPARTFHTMAEVQEAFSEVH